MRISDLSRQTGVPVATIKFYLREHLLPPGEPTGRNQATYGDRHLRRLRLIRALTAIGQLDLTSVRTLLTAIEDETLHPAQLYEVVDQVLGPQGDPVRGDDRNLASTRLDVDEFLSGLGWKVEPDAPSRSHLVIVLTALRQLGCDCTMDYFTPHAEAIERIAQAELNLSSPGEPDRAAAIARSVLLDVAFSAMRRMAQEHAVAMRFGRAAPRPT